MYFPYFLSVITFFILAISRSNFTQIQWFWTFFNSQDDELFKNVKDFRIWVKFYRIIVKKTLEGFFCSPFIWCSITSCNCYELHNHMLTRPRKLCDDHNIQRWEIISWLGWFLETDIYYYSVSKSTWELYLYGKSSW